jgi:hypothetical protein
MELMRRIYRRLRARRPARAGGYGAEVLFAGWVELPAAFRQLLARRRPAGRGRGA